MRSTAFRYRHGDYRRVCDICGRADLLRSQLVRRGDYLVCPDDSSGRSKRELTRAQANASRQRPLRPARNTRPDTDINVDQGPEGQIQLLLTSHGQGGVPPYRFYGVANGMGSGGIVGERSVFAAAWTCIYLYGVIAENKRPESWIRTDKAKLASLADYLVSIQYTAAGETLRGAWSAAAGEVLQDGGNVQAEVIAAAALGLLYAYRIHGTPGYLSAAKLTANCLRYLQRGGQHNSVYAARGDGISRYDSGTWSGSASRNGTAADFEHFYSPQALVALVFLNELRDIAGDGTYGDAATQDFDAPQGATITTMMNEATTFWSVTGAQNHSTGPFVRGFSSSDPYEYFAPQTSLGTGADAWTHLGSGVNRSISGQNYATGLWAWHRIYGYDAVVSDIWPWLMSFTSNPNTEDAGTQPIEDNFLGTYNPKRALTWFLTINTSTGVKENRQLFAGNPINGYAWHTAGLMSAIQSERAPSELRATKIALAAVQRRGRFDVDSPQSEQGALDLPILRGSSGLSYQVGGSNVVGGTFVHDAALAAMAALMYRQAPNIYGLKET